MLGGQSFRIQGVVPEADKAQQNSPEWAPLTKKIMKP